MTRGRAAAAAVALLALAIGLALALAGERQAAPVSAAAPPPAAAPTPLVATEAAPSGSAAPLPDSLAGTHVDGDLRLDAQGRFVPGPEALVLFDYFLSATGEEPDERIRARIVAEIRRRLAPDAARDAEALLERYLDYRDAARALFADERLASADVERRFQRIRELRREAFGAELAAALFGEEERVVAIDLERQRVLQQRGLDPAERARRLAGLEEQLPEAVRAARREATAVVDLRAAEAELRAAGAGSAAIQAERERRFGREAAERLAALDARRSAWDERVAAYRSERDALRAEDLPDDEYARRVSELRAARFAEPERLRIEALDRVDDASAPTSQAPIEE
ncbi:MAG: lipase chaperone [Proteobacteria bacterium]|nr:MAG: lipase chaperone [Pseudomonadota bacterium]